MDILFQIREDCREFFAFFYYLNRQGFFVGIDVDDDANKSGGIGGNLFEGKHFLAFAEGGFLFLLKLRP